MFKEITQQMQIQTSNFRGKRLQREWIRLEPVLKNWTMAELSQPAFNTPNSDAMQAALVRLAQGGCEIAALCLTCQLLPGLKKLSKTTAAGFEDPAAEVISAFYEVLGARDIVRRPAKVAANLILDTKQKLYRALLKDLKQNDIANTLAHQANQELRVGETSDLISRYSTIELIADALAGYQSKSRAQVSEIAFMHWIEGFSTQEIADQLGISQTAVTTKVWRLRQRIKAQTGHNLN